MDDYLYALLEKNLKDYSEIEVKKPWDWKEQPSGYDSLAD